MGAKVEDFDVIRALYNSTIKVSDEELKSLFIITKKWFRDVLIGYDVCRHRDTIHSSFLRMLKEGFIFESGGNYFLHVYEIRRTYEQMKKRRTAQASSIFEGAHTQRTHTILEDLR